MGWTREGGVKNRCAPTQTYADLGIALTHADWDGLMRTLRPPQQAFCNDRSKSKNRLSAVLIVGVCRWSSVAGRWLSILLALLRNLLDCGIEAGFLSRGGVFFDGFLLNGFVESFDGDFEPLLSVFGITLGDGLAGFLNRASEHSFDAVVFGGLALCDAHIFLGGFDDGHSGKLNSYQFNSYP